MKRFFFGLILFGMMLAVTAFILCVSYVLLYLVHNLPSPWNSIAVYVSVLVFFSAVVAANVDIDDIC